MGSNVAVFGVFYGLMRGCPTSQSLAFIFQAFSVEILGTVKLIKS